MQTKDEALNLNMVIIGASHAGVSAAFNLRQQGWKGRIILLDRDPQLPYHRPPLSKKTLQSDALVSSPLKAEKAYIDNEISLNLGQNVTSVDSKTQQITLANSEVIPFDKLIIATGCDAFIPPIKGLSDTVDETGVNRFFAMRTYADALAIKSALTNSKDKQVVIIGGGYIGLECASSFIALGAKVTVIEKQSHILSRVTSHVMSDFLTQLHRDKGVTLTTGKDVVEVIHQADKHIVVCGDGTQYPADFIIVGVGVRRNTQLAIAAGVDVEQGVKVNAVCQTSHPNIFSIGDCTEYFSQRYQRWLKLESVQNAVEQAKTVAQFITGNLPTVVPDTNTVNQTIQNDSRPNTQEAVPWFWSDQYQCKLQIVGLSDGYDELIVCQESAEQFSVWYFKADRLLCVEAVNLAKAYVLGTQAIKHNMQVNKSLLSALDTELTKTSLLIEPVTSLN
ncbi:FAD-dependent oxidoreductase [Shewanella olleyana]|uniref:NAD(P)/FAD-dependent oxidoreductase n=1 Tax=Shewanella olleyana TaxID=135626 RepID=UPI002010863D|nr:FAD-dependent oxidoreductase [Shewanella olleyana]MCL1065650.1 FAD-dependent oxidoreductase [Shewanella olleyana]